MMESTWTDDDQSGLIPLLTRQLELYRRLKRLSDRQRELVCQRDPQPLLALLAERREVVDQVATLNGRLTGLRDQIRPDLTPLSSDCRRQADSLLADAAATLQHILAADEQDAGLLRARRTSTADDLASLSTAGQACRAYARDLSPGGPALLNTDESA